MTSYLVKHRDNFAFYRYYIIFHNVKFLSVSVGVILMSKN
jgi:hypothetical protein